MSRKLAARDRDLRSVRLRAVWMLMVLGLALIAVAEERPAKPAAEANQKPLGSGWLIRVPLPLTGNADVKIREEVSRLIKKQESYESKQGAVGNGGDSRPVLILELSPGQSDAGRGVNFGKALDLAHFLTSREIERFRTVAYVPKTIKGHGVLLAAACSSLVMAPDAEIGEAGIDEETIEPTMRSGYTEISARHNTIPPAVAIGMLDKNAKVFKIVVGGAASSGTKFVLEKDLAEAGKNAQILSQEELRRPALFTGTEAAPDKIGFASFFMLAKDRAALALALNLPPEAVRERHTGEWNAKKILLTEPLNPKTVERARVSLDDEIKSHNANFILLVINSGGGSPADAQVLANYLADLDSSKVQTVAYITKEARSEAALVALSCDHVVMRPDATLGGFGNAALTPQQSRDLSLAYREIAKRKEHSWSLGAAMVDPTYRVYQYTRSGRPYQFTPEEAKEQEGEGKDFVQGEEITRAGSLLQLRSELAVKYGLAETVANDGELQKMFGLESDPPAVEPGWAMTLMRALASPQLGMLLLMIGGGAFLMELHAPGVGLGAFIGFICFLIYFWGHYLNGTAGWLQFLLFASGLICVLIEVFLLPGAAIFGFGGGLMILASIVLASQTFVIPRNEYQLEQFRDTLLMLAGAGAGIVGIGVLIRRYLHRAPGFNRMLLQPLSDQEVAQLSRRESLVNYERLLGKQGVTATLLAPAGKARFGDELVDVLSQGDFIDRNVPIVVIDVHGSRVIVRAV